MFCPGCGKEIPDTIRFCPECGCFMQGNGSDASEPNGTSKSKRAFSKGNVKRQNKSNGCLGAVAGVFLFFVVIGLFASSEEGKDTSSANNNVVSATESTTEPPIEISASKLIKAYQENEINASKKLKGRYLKVTGYVDQVSRSDNLFLEDGYYVYIDYGNEWDFNTICCSLNEESVDAASELKPGDKITIIGRCEGFETIHIKMYDCDIVK